MTVGFARVDVHHDMTKTRLSRTGEMVEGPKGKELKGDLERITVQKAEGYCASLSPLSLSAWS